MPYKSESQRRFFNSEAGKKQIGEKEVEKWNKESKGLDLPEKANKDEFTCDNIIKEYSFSIKKGADLKKVKVSANCYKEALNKVKSEAKNLKFKGNKVKSKFDNNKLDTRDF